MKPSLLEILACPKCLGDLELNVKTFKEDEIVDGNMWCPRCDMIFLIKDGVSIFGIKRENATERYREIEAENRWVYDANKLQVHIDYAIESSKYLENLIPKLKKRIRSKSIENKKLRVLDLGAGWGAFQSWQFSKYGFEVIALELCPEFMFATDYVLQNGDVFFERTMADCTLLPFRNGTFDVIFCKEIVHHVKNLDSLFNEISRIASSSSIIVVLEPCNKIFPNLSLSKSRDLAAEVGLTHQHYTYLDYIGQMKKIAMDIERDEKIVSVDPSKRPMLSILLKSMERILNWMARKERLRILQKTVRSMAVILAGGELELIGTARPDRDEYVLINRDIIPINLDNLRLNEQKLNYYRCQLIPEVFKVFSAAYGERDIKHKP